MQNHPILFFFSLSVSFLFSFLVVLLVWNGRGGWASWRWPPQFDRIRSGLYEAEYWSRGEETLLDRSRSIYLRPFFFPGFSAIGATSIDASVWFRTTWFFDDDYDAAMVSLISKRFSYLREFAGNRYTFDMVVPICCGLGSYDYQVCWLCCFSILSDFLALSRAYVRPARLFISSCLFSVQWLRLSTLLSSNDNRLTGRKESKREKRKEIYIYK